MKPPLKPSQLQAISARHRAGLPHPAAACVECRLERARLRELVARACRAALLTLAIGAVVAIAVLAVVALTSSCSSLPAQTCDYAYRWDGTGGPGARRAPCRYKGGRRRHRGRGKRRLLHSAACGL